MVRAQTPALSSRTQVFGRDIEGGLRCDHSRARAGRQQTAARNAATYQARRAPPGPRLHIASVVGGSRCLAVVASVLMRFARGGPRDRNARPLPFAWLPPTLSSLPQRLSAARGSNFPKTETRSENLSTRARHRRVIAFDSFPRLTSLGRIGPMGTPNRIVLPAVDINPPDSWGVGDSVLYGCCVLIGE